MKVLRFLLGLVIGAGVALLVAPKSGRELRQQLVGGASGKLLGAAPDEYPQPEPAAWGGSATAVAEPPSFVEEPVVPVEPEVVDEVVVTEAVTEEVIEEAAPAPKPFPDWEERAGGAGDRRPARAHRRDARGARERARGAVRGPDGGARGRGRRSSRRGRRRGRRS